MSCTLSCSTDSGARNPCTVATFVAVAAGVGAGTGTGAAGGAAAADGAAVSARDAVVSDAGGALSGRTQAAAASATYRHVILTLSPPPALSCAPPPLSAPHRAGL